MSVDYHHRLIVSGPREDVRIFRRRMHYEYPRTVASKSWTEIVPFSFTALYVLAPDARRVEPEQPGDPLELSVWPVKKLDERNAEVRYRFHTRNFEVAPLMRVLARALPVLTFRLTTLCLDDSSIESHLMIGRRVSKWVLPGYRRNFHWSCARAKFNLAGDTVYDDEHADRWAEERMLAEAVSHWDGAGKVLPPDQPAGYQWWNQVVWRELEVERQVLLAEYLARERTQEAARQKQPRRKRNRSSRKR